MTIADKCPFCNGIGYVKQDSMGVSGYTLFKCSYCGGSGNNRYPSRSENKENRHCPYYEEEIDDGVISQIFCIHLDIFIDGEYKCPYGEEFNCEILIHRLNLKRLEK